MKLSVIVPVYNVEAYLDTCITSLITQTEAFDEILLINDGSADRSEEICKAYASRYSNITLISQNNRGLAAARNTGLKNVTGDYVLFIDSDDYVRSRTCEVIKKALHTEKIQVLYYNAEIQYDIPSPEKKDAFCHIDELDGACMQGMKYFERVFPGQYTVSACIAAYHRKFLEEFRIAFPEGIYFEDNLFSLQVISNADCISGIPDTLYIRRCRENSIMTSSMSEKKSRDLITNQELMWQYLGNNPVWLAQKELLRRFIAFGVLHTFYDLSKCTQKKLITSFKHRFTDLFFKNWRSLFLEEHRDYEADLAYVLMLKECLVKKKECKREREQMEEQIWNQILMKLSGLPFREENINVGIYGIGVHTEVLLRLYEEKIGKIQANLFFLVSSEYERKEFRNREVFCYKKMPENTGCILISSFVYQKEMYRNLLEQGIGADRICFLYTEKSICDLTMAVRILNDESDI